MYEFFFSNDEDYSNSDYYLYGNNIKFNEEDENLYSYINNSYNEPIINNYEKEEEKRSSENDSIKTKASLNQIKDPYDQPNSHEVIFFNDPNEINSNTPQTSIEQEMEQNQEKEQYQEREQNHEKEPEKEQEQEKEKERKSDGSYLH